MTLDEFNNLSNQDAEKELLKCCGSRNWARKVAAVRPFKNISELESQADHVWKKSTIDDWLEAFEHHPRIGEKSVRDKWASQEQAGVAAASEETIQGLVDGNKEYEEEFGHIFLISATGKSAEEILKALEERLENDPDTELAIAAGEQAKITKLRLGKMFS